MQRRKFIRSGCTMCMGVMAGVSLISLMDSCATGKILKLAEIDKILTVDETEFTETQTFLILRTASIPYDILLNKIADGNYSAVLMQCTHYDNPVYASKTELFCPSHGSKFDFNGKVTKDPATVNLKQYKTTIENKQIKILLT